MRALREQGFERIPKVHALCEDTDVLGFVFYVMEKSDGHLVGRSGVFPEVFDTSKEGLHALGKGAVEALAELHALDVETGPLSSLGKPDGYLLRQVDGWTKRWHGSRIDAVDEMDRLAELLAAQMPTAGTPSVVHNDYKIDNLMLRPMTSPRSRRFWIGKWRPWATPLTDIGYFVAMWLQEGDPPVFLAFGLAPTAVPEAPTRQQLRDWYADASGRTLPSSAGTRPLRISDLR